MLGDKKKALFHAYQHVPRVLLLTPERPHFMAICTHRLTFGDFFIDAFFGSTSRPADAECFGRRVNMVELHNERMEDAAAVSAWHILFPFK